MTLTSMSWPARDEYDLAMLRWTETLRDPDLVGGRLACDQMGICRFGGANLYVSIYKIGDWMVRCFCSNPTHQTPVDICERYRAIEHFCQTNVSRVSALVPLTYLEQGIMVGTRILPLVKMPFLTGCPSLGEFLADHYDDSLMIQRLCDAWVRMIRELEAASMAHGDLDLSNVLVEQRGPALTLRLIDYDNTWILELVGRKQTEYGHNNFQHPHFLPPHQRPYNAQMDRFSALVIYISLKMLILYPHLYEDWGADESDRLLLTETDYQNAGLMGSRIIQLRNMCVPELYPYLDELNVSLREGRMPASLSEIAYSSKFVVQHVQQPVPSSVPSFQPLSSSFAPPPPAIAVWGKVVYNTDVPIASPASLSQSATLPRNSSGEMRQPSTAPTSLWQWQPPEPSRPCIPGEDAGRPYPSVHDGQSQFRTTGPAPNAFRTPFPSQPRAEVHISSMPSSPQPMRMEESVPQTPFQAWKPPTLIAIDGVNNNNPSPSPTSDARKSNKGVYILIGLCAVALILLIASIILIIMLMNKHASGSIFSSFTIFSGVMNVIPTIKIYEASVVQGDL